MKFPEMYKVVPVANALDISADHAYTDSINMSGYHRATFLLQIGALGVASSHVKVYSGAADATYTSSLPFKYAFGGAATGTATCDVLAADSIVAGAAALTDIMHITFGTYSNYMLIIEVDAADMDMANQEEWLAVDFNDFDTGCTGLVYGFAILEPRYTQARSVTALT
jgi:hypothetical protein